jgi:acyl carrier protein
MIFEQIRDIIVEKLNVKAEKVTMDTNLVDDLGADSLDAAEIVMAIEDQFNIQFDDDASQSIKKVSDIVNYVEKKTNK